VAPGPAAVSAVRALVAALVALVPVAAASAVPPGPGGRDRSANFGPPAPPKRLRGAKKGGSQQENKPRGPIKERSDGRIYAVDDLDDAAAPIDYDDIATSLPDDKNDGDDEAGDE
jgi:hypothetical protein